MAGVADCERSRVCVQENKLHLSFVAVRLGTAIRLDADDGGDDDHDDNDNDYDYDWNAPV